MSSEIVFTILLQHILTFDHEGGGKSWGEAEVRMMLDQWKPFKCFTQTECFTAALWNGDWKLFSSYYWPPVAKYKSSVDFDSSNPVHHLFLCRISHCWTLPPPNPPVLICLTSCSRLISIRSCLCWLLLTLIGCQSIADWWRIDRNRCEDGSERGRKEGRKSPYSQQIISGVLCRPDVSSQSLFHCCSCPFRSICHVHYLLVI